MKQVISTVSERSNSKWSDNLSSLRGFMNTGDESTGEVVIIVDNREQRCAAVQELLKLRAEIRFTQLSSGGYILSDRVAVERKTSMDFVTSLIDGRLFSQAEELKEQYQVPILIIEGEDTYSNPGVSENAILGALSSLAIDFGLPILHLKNASETSKLLYLTALREQVKERRLPRIRDGRKPASLYEMQVYLLSGLPLVERATAEKLLAKFKTPSVVFNATDKELMQVDGIGEKKARGIREVVDTEVKEKVEDITGAH